jgi:hypothetical protein
VLRATPRSDLSVEAVKEMLARKGLFDLDRNRTGRGFASQYEAQHDGQVLFDRSSGLAWQRSGSVEPMTFQKAMEYVAYLNRRTFAGGSDWRLPTLEEAMSLMEPEVNGAALHIDSRFDAAQQHMWTADGWGSSAWVVHLDYGYCQHYGSSTATTYVRAVR